MSLLKRAFASATCSPGFWHILALLLLSGSIVLLFNPSFYLLLLILAVNILEAFGISALVRTLHRMPRLAHAVFLGFVVLLNVMFIVNVYLAIQFGKLYDDEIYYVMVHANQAEVSGFFSSQLSPGVILSTIAIVGIANYAACLFSKLAVRISRQVLLRTAAVMIPAAVAAIAVWAVMLFSGKPAPSIFKASTIGNFTVPLMQRDNERLEAKAVLRNCELLEGKVSSNPNDSTIYIFILGESDNKFHNSMYGYPLNTQPRLSNRLDSGQIVRFDNCITHYPITHKAMKSVFSFSKDLEETREHSVFPAVFRVAGYHVSMYDNECNEDPGDHFMYNPDVIKLCYDKYSPSSFEYDETILGRLDHPRPRSLTIIHLFGQHFDAGDRVPDDFEKPFSIDDYKGFVKEDLQKPYRDFDNATAYVDFVVDSILKTVEEEKACVVYVTDHGQWAPDNEPCEIEYGVKILRKQMMLIPFWVWGSEKFRNSSAKWQLLKDAATLPVTSDDISHFLMDLCDISVDEFDPTRSCINPRYDPRQSRFTVHERDFVN